MPRTNEPSNPDLVRDVMRDAEGPLTVDEIIARVNARRPITTKNPRATVQSILSQSRQLVNLGDYRHGYLPHLVNRSLLRLPLPDGFAIGEALAYPDEVRDALWPSNFEARKRQNLRPVELGLPNGDVARLTLEALDTFGVWGCPTMPPALSRFLDEQQAVAGDALLITVIDGEAGRAEAAFEPARMRDEEAVDRRNRDLANAVEALLRRGLYYDHLIWQMTVPLLAQGLYQDSIAPDPLGAVLGADARFVDGGLGSWLLAETMTDEDWNLVNVRKKMEEDIFPEFLALSDEEIEPDLIVSPRVMPASMERTLADLTALLEEKDFDSIDEANAFLSEMMANGEQPPHRAETPLARAQDLIYDAWEEPSERKRVQLARQALKLSPDCADAYVVLAEDSARTLAKAAELYAEGVAAGERALGPEIFEYEAGGFWGILETRPYMRARFGLADTLWELDRRDEAIDHLWAMLRLNPNDNQGLRYVLLGWLLERGEHAGVKRLLGQYRDEVSATWLYGAALHGFRDKGDNRRSRKLLHDALAANPYVPDYLLGWKQLPAQLPELIGLGDEREAVESAARLLVAWSETEGALDWLSGHLR